MDTLKPSPQKDPHEALEEGEPLTAKRSWKRRPPGTDKEKAYA